MVEKTIVVCPYCGTGCKMNLLTENGKTVGVEPLNGVNNEGDLCLKGYYGYDFINDTKILTPRLRYPLMRRSRDEEFKRVSWEEAINYTAERLNQIKAESGPDAIYVTGSSRGCGNEANFVMQKFARAVVGTNNIDNCARI